MFRLEEENMIKTYLKGDNTQIYIWRHFWASIRFENVPKVYYGLLSHVSLYCHQYNNSLSVAVTVIAQQ